MNGIIVINKEQDFTSFDVVAKLRGILKQKKLGHTGTLDPQATGVLPICLGSATKLCDMLTDKKKEYIAEFVLGKTTDTQDIWGKVLSETDINCGEDEVKAVVEKFVGELMQVPPMYSAVWFEGKRLYELARMGIEVERKARPVLIHEIEVMECRIPKLKIRIVCSKGTYIRTLIHDIGESLGCGATMTSLQRTMSGQFRIEDAVTFQELEELRDQGRLNECFIPVDAVFRDLPAIVLDETMGKVILNGNLINRKELATLFIYLGEGSCLERTSESAESLCTEDRKCRVYFDKNNKRYFMAIYRFYPEKNGIVVDKMFLPEELKNK